MGVPLQLVAGVGAKAPPYPADTRCAGWRFQIDGALLRQSKTWKLAAPEVRPWLFMLWWSAWDGEIPSGSLPDDDELIAATIGMQLAQFQAWRVQLMRGWWKATDGRLYHEYITALVLDRRAWKDGERARKQAYRSRYKNTVPHVSRGTDADATQHDDAGAVAGAVAVDLALGSVSEKVLRRSPARATRLPADWRLPEPWKDWAVTVHHLEPDRVVRISLTFRDFWCAKAGASASKLDWLATWRNWIRKEVGDA